jgi:hypothetical protein
MSLHIRVLLAVLVAAVMMAAAIGAASANRLSLDDQDFAFKWTDEGNRLTYIGGYGGGTNIECEVTLSGSFTSRTITKTRELHIGYITRTSIDTAGCVGGAWRFSTETLPWRVHYRAFTGTLPTITAVQTSVIGYTYLVAEIGSSCVSRSTAEEPVVERLVLTRGVVTALSPDPAFLIDGTDLAESFLCDTGFRMNFDGASARVEDGSGGTVGISLI